MSAANSGLAPQVRGVDGGRAGALAPLHSQAFDRAWSAEELKRVMDGPCTFTLEAGHDEDPCGFIVVRAVAGEAEILTLAVHPDARRQGLGRALVQEAATTAQTLGAEAFWLEVAIDNAAAIALYAAAGFEVAGRRPGYYTRKESPGVDALVMRRLLNRAQG